MKPIFTICAASLLALLVAPACVTDLGKWQATDINDGGVIVGRQAAPNGASHAVVRLRNGALKQLPNLRGDTSSEAVAVTTRGVVIGNGTSAAGRHPVVWETDGSVRSLGQLDGRDTRAVAANDSEVIVGIVYDPFRAWIYDPAVGHIEELPVPPGASATEATAINDKGEVAGVVGYLTGSRAVRWEPDTYAFSLLPILEFPAEIAIGDINENGTIVGTHNGRPTVWQPGAAQPTTLPTGTWAGGRALAINDAGVIVGNVEIDRSTPGSGAGGIYMGKAALWTLEGELVDLDPDGNVGPTVASEAVAINASGAVVGNTNRTPENPGGRATQFR